jgi:putative membrane protein
MKYFNLFIKGMFMGAADLVPGVSGGTIALIMGIYKELIDSINGISWSLIKTLPQKGIKKTWKEANGSFLLSTFSGILTSILLLSRLLEWLFENEPIILWSFFFGLLVASIFILIKRYLTFSLPNTVLLLIGATLAFWSTQLNGVQNDTSLLYLFFCGFIAISAMILPGLSGAYLLVILGVYQFILSRVRLAQEIIFNFNLDQFIDLANVLGVFILGIIVGIKLFSKFLSWLLHRYPQKTIAVLIGLMGGALHKVWPWQNSETINGLEKTFAVLPQYFEGNSIQLGKAFLFAFIGFGFLFLLENRKGISKT